MGYRIRPDSGGVVECDTVEECARLLEVLAGEKVTKPSLAYFSVPGLIKSHIESLGVATQFRAGVVAVACGLDMHRVAHAMARMAKSGYLERVERGLYTRGKLMRVVG